MRRIVYIAVLLLALVPTGCRMGTQAPSDMRDDSRRARRQAGKLMEEVVDKVEFKELENITLHGLSGVDVEVRVANNTNMKLSVEKLEFIFRLDGQALASGFLSQEVVLDKRSESVVLLPLKLRIDNPLTVLSAISAFRSDPSRITVSGTGTVKAGGIVRKKIEIRDMPIGELMENMGVSKEAVLERIKL